MEVTGTDVVLNMPAPLLPGRWNAGNLKIGNGQQLVTYRGGVTSTRSRSRA
jgi:hypothetical protein